MNAWKISLFKLLLDAQLVRMAALLFPAVNGARRQASIAPVINRKEGREKAKSTFRSGLNRTLAVSLLQKPSKLMNIKYSLSADLFFAIEGLC